MNFRRALLPPVLLLPVLSLFAATATAQELPSRWDELTASDWPRAQERANYTCVLPIGILEKHGPHVPLGADLIHVRELSARAVKQEYAVVFPDFFYGQIYEAQHTPGTFALPSRVVWDLLDATVEEIGRNGFKKIVIVNGHGGNPELLRFFIQSQLERRRDYVVYFFDPEWDDEFAKKMQEMRKSDAATDLHAGENETSLLLALRPDLVQMDRAARESGADEKRINTPGLYTAIWWYARFPNHYAGEGAKATRELGQTIVEHRTAALVKALRAVKADDKTLQIQREYFDKVKK
ncbi:MAG TPA: creatininase family protein [Pyrinomonadaceae bacterium]|nr:creatininase family protein [Pyrinomonadaceae bacterium]